MRDADLKNVLIFQTKPSEVLKIMRIKWFQMFEAWKLTYHLSVTLSMILWAQILLLCDLAVTFMKNSTLFATAVADFFIDVFGHVVIIAVILIFIVNNTIMMLFLLSLLLQIAIAFIFFHLLANLLHITRVVLLHRWLRFCFSHYVFNFGKYLHHMRIFCVV